MDKLDALSELVELLDDWLAADAVAVVDTEKFAEVAEETLSDALELVSQCAEAGTTKAKKQKRVCASMAKD